MKMTRIIQIVNYVLIAISIVFITLFYVGGVVPGTEGTSSEEPLITGSMLRWSYFLMLASAFLAVAVSVINIFSNMASLKKSLFSIGTIGLITIVSFLFSSGEVMTIVGYTGADNVPSVLKLVDTAIYMMYITLFASFGLILYTSIAKYFK